MNLIQKFFSWGYARYVFVPELKRQIAILDALDDTDGEFEIEFVASDELQAMLDRPDDEELN